MVKDNRGDPLDNIFDEVERAMNDMTEGGAGFASETHIDMYDEGSTLRLAADLPGVDKDAIDLRCDGETLTISAVGNRREYDERIRLLARADEHSVSATFNNGILQTAFDRAEDSAAVDVE